MKRFFCNTCRRIKRVRRIPKNVNPIFGTSHNGDQIVTGYSAGDCDYHKAAVSNSVLRHGAPVRNVVTKKSAPPPSPPRKAKR